MAEVILENVTKRFGGTLALDNVSLEVPDGSFVVLLVWVYYSTQIFLLGAEFTWVYSHERGSRQGHDRGARERAPAHA